MKTLSIVVTLIALLFLYGCGSNDPLPAELSADEQAIQQIVVNSDSISGFSQSDESLINDPSETNALTTDQNSVALSKMGYNETNTHIKVLRWNRRVTNVTTNISTTVSDTFAISIINKIVTGNIEIAGSYNDTASFPDTVIRKPFTERLMRKVLLHKVARTVHPEHNWKPAAISLVEGTTLPDSSNAFVIQNLQVITPADTFTVTNPLTTWLGFGNIRHGVPKLRHTDSLIVRVTIFSTSDSSESVFSRWNGERANLRERMRLVSTTQVAGGYIRVFQFNAKTRLPFGKDIGRCSILADVFSYGSITDDNITVSNRLWGFPYDVRN